MADDSPNTPMLDAACHRNWPEMQRLLESNGSPNERGYGGQSPLMFAARAGKGLLCRLLLQAGAEVNCKDLVRNTALHEAAHQGHVECVGLLLHAKADLRMRGHC